MMNEHDIDIAEISYNKPQQNFMLHLWRGAIKKANNIWGRATGKSTVIAVLIDMIVRTMPRATWSIQGATFQQLLTLTLPGTFEGLEKLGYRKDVNYFIRKRPDGVNMPYWTPFKFDNFITFVRPDRNAVGFALLSQDREGSARGPSFDGNITDESLTINYERYTRETKATNRGHEEYFKKHPLHHAEFHFSSMPFGADGQWLLKPSHYYEDEGYDFRALRNRMIDLQLQFIKERDKKTKLEIYGLILQLDKKLRSFPSKNGFYYSEANAFDNLTNLSLRYIHDLHDGMTETMFLIEVLNKHINKIDGGFYSSLDRVKHGYKGSFNYSFLDSLDFDFSKIKSLDSRQDKDCIDNLPLDIGMDFGVHINWLVVAQELKSINRINFIKNFYVKAPKIVDHVVLEFCEYYKYHKKKEVNLWPDAQGNSKQINSTQALTDQVVKILRDNGWIVHVKNRGKKNPSHNDKYLLWALLLLRRDKIFPEVGFNLINCKELMVSMELAPAIDDGRAGIRKNKSSEKLFKQNREEATDGSDAADQIVFGKYANLLKYKRALPFLTNL
jgi:hypothetical protein